MTRTFAAAVLSGVLVLGGAACTDDESASTTTETTDTTEAPRNLSVSTPAGEVSLNLDGELPDDWPEDFPLPDGAEAAGSGSLADEDSGVLVGVFSTSASAEEALEFYADDASLDPTEERSAGVGSAFVGSVDISGEFDGSITVAGVESTNYIVVVLNTGGAAPADDGGSSGDAGTSDSSTTTSTTG